METEHVCDCQSDVHSLIDRPLNRLNTQKTGVRRIAKIAVIAKIPKIEKQLLASAFYLGFPF